MRPRRYFSTVVLLLVGLSFVSSLQELTSETTTNAPSTVETTTQRDNGLTASPSTTSTTNTTASPSTSKPTNTTQAPTTTKKPTAKPTAPASKPVANCLDRCICPTERELICEGLELTQLPKLESKSTFVRLRFAHNNIELLDFRQFRNADKIELLDFSDNNIKTIAQPKKASAAILTLLTRLNLSDNLLESISDLNTWIMPNLEQLDVSMNKIKQLQLGPVDSRPKLTKLIASQLQLSEIDDQAFVAAPRLTFVNLSAAHADGGHFLENSVFARQTQLETLDLSRNNLLEVPLALRIASGLKTLILNTNSMTSLRPSDLMNLPSLEHLELRGAPYLQRVDAYAFGALTNLRTLLLSNNTRLYDFSPEAFTPIKILPVEYRRQLKLVDLSSNNITTMARIDDEFATIAQLRLSGNPLDCNCQLEWLVKMPNWWQQQPIHCTTPAKYRDLELSRFFEMHDCTVDDSILQRCVVTLCILFLLLVTIAVFVQKTDLCRRLRRRDQYGTIYYTKASFPQEQI